MRTLVCIPCMDFVDTDFMRSILGLRPVGEVNFAVTKSSLIYDARNILAVQAITGGYDRTLWLDSDMVFEPDLMERLSKHLDEGADLASGLYFTRTTNTRPVIYEGCGVFEVEGKKQNVAVVYEDYPDGVFDIEACGFGGVMVSTKLLIDVRERFGHLFSPISGFGEDLSFCMRAKVLNAKMVCDSSVKMGHIGSRIVTEETYKEFKKNAEQSETCATNCD